MVRVVRTGVGMRHLAVGGARLMGELPVRNACLMGELPVRDGRTRGGGVHTVGGWCVGLAVRRVVLHLRRDDLDTQRLGEAETAGVHEPGEHEELQQQTQAQGSDAVSGGSTHD